MKRKSPRKKRDIRRETRKKILQEKSILKKRQFLIR
jgi:hypothetical protein